MCLLPGHALLPALQGAAQPRFPSVGWGRGHGWKVTASLCPKLLLSGCFWVSGELSIAICQAGEDTPPSPTPWTGV